MGIRRFSTVVLWPGDVGCWNNTSSGRECFCCRRSIAWLVKGFVAPSQRAACSSSFKVYGLTVVAGAHLSGVHSVSSS